MSEFHDEYSEALDGEFRKLEDALLSDSVIWLLPRVHSRAAIKPQVLRFRWHGVMHYSPHYECIR